METIRFSSLYDFENYAKGRLDPPTYAHIKGEPRPEDHFTDFFNIKLKARGMANLKYFKGLKTHVLVKPTESPICVGPLPPLSDIKMVAEHQAAHGEIIQ
jgi:hypothetical protein